MSAAMHELRGCNGVLIRVCTYASIFCAGLLMSSGKVLQTVSLDDTYYIPSRAPCGRSRTPVAMLPSKA